MNNSFDTNTASFSEAVAPALLNPVAPAPKPAPVQDKQLETILKRLEDCQDLVETELDEYRHVAIPSAPSQKTDYKLSIIIPVYNEEKTIMRVVSRVAALPLNTEIIIVDDNSTDGTRDLLEKLVSVPNLKIFLKTPNQGKGAALRTGFERSTGDYIVVQDADLEYNPRDIPQLLEPLLNGEADVVYGSRFLGDEVQDESFVHRLGNSMLTGALNLLSGLKLTDMETCYKVFTREVIDSITLEQDRFGIEPEITAKLARQGFRFSEVPISYKSRGYTEGKKIGIKDLFNALYCIGRYGAAD